MTVIVDQTNRRVLDVLNFRDKDKLVEYLRQAKESGLLSELQEVTSDMWSGFIAAVQEVFGDAVRITIDRFHVSQQLTKRLTEARREVQRGLDKEAKKELKGSRWLWVSNQENLTAEQKEKLRELFEDKQIKDRGVGAKKLREWMVGAKAMKSEALNKFCVTLDNHLDMIANYFVSRASNGRVEGFNHGLRVVLWRSFGMSSFAHFRLRVLDRFRQHNK